MSKTMINGDWMGNMGFQLNLDGHKLVTDASFEIGGNDRGPRPKQLLLAGLIGCTGIDVMSILKKMKVEVEDCSIEVIADSTEEHPRVYKDIHLIYKFKGKGLQAKNIEKAVSLSQEKYCGVSAMLKKAAPITYEIIIEE